MFEVKQRWVRPGSGHVPGLVESSIWIEGLPRNVDNTERQRSYDTRIMSAILIGGLNGALRTALGVASHPSEVQCRS
jgi:hypothetical protein